MNLGYLRIPYFQPLSPGDIFIRKNGNTRIFPFSSDKAIYYYLARNGIWHGIDVLGLKQGDEVLMPAYHHGVEVQVLKSKGLRLRYYGINKNLEIDLDDLESSINSRTRLIYVIHYIGIPQPIQYIKNLAEKKGILLFEDCALSLFSQLPTGEPLGTFGDLSIFCLYKSLPVPHGGVLVANRKDLDLKERTEIPNLSSTAGYFINRLLDYIILNLGSGGYKVSLLMRNTGRFFKRATNVKSVAIDTNEFEARHVNLGISRITRHLLSCIDFEKVTRLRRNNFKYLAQKLSGIIEMPVNELPEGTCPLFLPVFVGNKSAVHEQMRRIGIGTVNFWSIQNADIPIGTFPDVDYLRQHVLEVPIHQGIGKKHLDLMAEELIKHARV